MTTDEAREIQSRVMRLGHENRQRDGRSQLSKADVDYAYAILYPTHGTGYNTLPEWKTAVISASSHPIKRRETQEKKGFLNRYTDLATRRDFLPDDEFLEETWGAGDGTFSSIRNRLRKRGFDFVGAEGRTWKVTARPQPEPEPEPVKRPSVQAILEERGETPMVVTRSTPHGGLPMLQQIEKTVQFTPFVPFESQGLNWEALPSPTDSDRLDTIITLLRELLEVWTR